MCFVTMADIANNIIVISFQIYKTPMRKDEVFIYIYFRNIIFLRGYSLFYQFVLSGSLRTTNYNYEKCNIIPWSRFWTKLVFCVSLFMVDESKMFTTVIIFYSIFWVFWKTVKPLQMNLYHFFVPNLNQIGRAVWISVTIIKRQTYRQRDIL